MAVVHGCCVTLDDGLNLLLIHPWPMREDIIFCENLVHWLALEDVHRLYLSAEVRDLFHARFLRGP